MKKSYLLLAGFGILLLGFLLYQFALPKEPATPAKEAGSVSVDIPLGSMETWNWIFSEVSPQGVQFMYPEPLPTTYVKAVTWPPEVEVSAEDFTCVVGSVPGTSGGPSLSAQRTIEGREYCVSFVVEGAAGSAYTTYTYTTPQDAVVASVSFTVQKPQCLNYDEVERNLCKSEQLLFNVDQLAVQILSSITTR